MSCHRTGSQELRDTSHFVAFFYPFPLKYCATTSRVPCSTQMRGDLDYNSSGLRQKQNGEGFHVTMRLWCLSVALTREEKFWRYRPASFDSKGWSSERESIKRRYICREMEEKKGREWKWEGEDKCSERASERAREREREDRGKEEISKFERKGGRNWRRSWIIENYLEDSN